MYNLQMVFTHAFAGALVTNLAIRNKSLTDKQKSALYTIGILGAIFPDLDFILIILKFTETHRDLLTHSLLPYTVGLFVWILSAKKSDFRRLGGVIFYLGVLSHLFLDFLTGGIVVLAPISFMIYGIALPLTQSRVEWARMYFTSWKYMGGEFLLLLSYLYVMRSEKNKIVKLLPWLFFGIAGLIVLVFLSI